MSICIENPSKHAKRVSLPFSDVLDGLIDNTVNVFSLKLLIRQGPQPDAVHRVIDHLGKHERIASNHADHVGWHLCPRKSRKDQAATCEKKRKNYYEKTQKEKTNLRRRLRQNRWITLAARDTVKSSKHTFRPSRDSMNVRTAAQHPHRTAILARDGVASNRTSEKLSVTIIFLTAVIEGESKLRNGRSFLGSTSPKKMS